MPPCPQREAGGAAAYGSLSCCWCVCGRFRCEKKCPAPRGISPLAALNISRTPRKLPAKIGLRTNIGLLLTLAASLRHTMAERPHTHMWLDHMGAPPMGLRAPGAVDESENSAIAEPGPDPPRCPARAGPGLRDYQQQTKQFPAPAPNMDVHMVPPAIDPNVVPPPPGAPVAPRLVAPLQLSRRPPC